MHPTKNSLSEETRGRSAAVLNQFVADLSDLRSQTKQAHWNVRSRHFYALHKFFDELAALLDEPVDDVAERVTALGGIARGTVRQAATASRLPEMPDAGQGDLAFVELLRDRYAVVANDMRRAIEETAALGDADTADLLTGISRELDKALWMLEAHNP